MAHSQASAAAYSSAWQEGTWSMIDLIKSIVKVLLEELPSESTSESDVCLTLEQPYDISEDQLAQNDQWIKDGFKDFPEIQIEVQQTLAMSGGTGNA
eukprot:2582084-Amphidinium_carterae.1